MTDCLWHLYAEEGGGGRGSRGLVHSMPFDCLAIVEVNVPSQPRKRPEGRMEVQLSVWSLLIPWVEDLIAGCQGWKSKLPTWLFDTTQQGTGCPGTAWRRQYRLEPPPASAGVGVASHCLLFVLLGWSVAHLISTLCPFLACPFPCPGLEKAGFFCLHPFVISR